MLPIAWRERELDLRGALFPWRTIRGDEASAYHLAGTAQFHLNADIAYAIRRYIDVAGSQFPRRDRRRDPRRDREDVGRSRLLR